MEMSFSKTEKIAAIVIGLVYGIPLAIGIFIDGIHKGHLVPMIVLVFYWVFWAIVLFYAKHRKSESKLLVKLKTISPLIIGGGYILLRWFMG